MGFALSAAATPDSFLLMIHMFQLRAAWRDVLKGLCDGSTFIARLWPKQTNNNEALAIQSTW